MIKFLDLQKVNSRFEVQFQEAFNNFLHSGQYILGDQVSAFEKTFAEYCGTKYCIGVNSGLDALQLIFEAYKLLGNLNEGDEVIVPANTFIASIFAIKNSRLKPVLVEPDSNTFNIDVSKIEKAITKNTKAILGVHLYGQLYDVEGLEKLSKKYNLLLIEDAAQAHGAVFNDGRKAGNVSEVAGFSFYPSKNLGALGDAGAVTTNNKQLAEIIIKLRNYGTTSKYVNQYSGYNSRLDDLQAAFLSIKLELLDTDNIRRQGIAQRYISEIKNKKILLPKCISLASHVFHLFVIQVKERKHFIDYLSNCNIETAIHYPIAPHKQEAFSHLASLNLPITYKIHETVVSLPISPVMSDEDVLKVIKVINLY